MAEEEVAKIAKERGVTRATVSMEKAAQIEKPVIFAIGNAPTALIELYEMIQSGSYRPAFIIGVPVGFVNVEAAKDLILKTDVPYIINREEKAAVMSRQQSAMHFYMNFVMKIKCKFKKMFCEFAV